MEKTTTTTSRKIEKTNLITLPLNHVQWVKELYPRAREDEATIERYRAAIDRLPPITVARGRILVDGFHRWQAYRRENVQTVQAEDLGNLSDIEILKEAIRRNACHGRQLDTSDKRRNADHLYRVLQGSQDDRYREISELLSITPDTAKKYCEEARRDEKELQRAKVWDLWLNCFSERQIEEQSGVARKTINDWLGEKRKDSEFAQPPESLQHSDIWTLPATHGDSRFGKMHPQVVENLLWLYTETGQIVFDPMVGAGTTIEVAKRMGRRVWASDLKPHTPTLPIHPHDITAGWPEGAPTRVDFILLDPPCWQNAKGKHTENEADLGKQTFDHFMGSWRAIIHGCKIHLAKNGRLAFIISPTETDDNVSDHTFQMWRVCADDGLVPEHRIIIPYREATEQQKESARQERKLLKSYRDLVIMHAKSEQ